MKINCHCGAQIVDNTDGLPYKATLIPDQLWDELFKAFRSLEKGGPSSDEPLMRLLATGTRLMWQCSECGRLYIDDPQHELQCFLPCEESTTKQILRK